MFSLETNAVFTNGTWLVFKCVCMCVGGVRWLSSKIVGCYSCRHTLGLKTLFNPGPGDLKLSSGFSGHQTHVWCTAILRGKTPIYIKLKQILKKKTLQFTSKSYSQVNVVIHYLFRSFKNTPVGCCSETIHGVCDCSRLPLKCCHGMKL